jgi:hypothetical protein
MNIKFCFKTGNTTTETFKLMKEAMVTMLSLIHEFFNCMQDFGTTAITSSMTKAVDDQQPFEHLT